MSNVKDIRAYKYFGANLYTPTKYADLEALLRSLLKKKVWKKAR